ncbi:uncharacterized protein BP5553_07889 [Venustampulla echinocandica]|uniref:Nephrocystin 3-like N-terminal domain-containing protein n=1 Tax=Venustampulla echinocandica TaxID=2656787 RepID=A0A370THT9_9HELO|nr:uncharacterized protein BP5553_07889 [Venustampulla echinocandica]RDL34761.1 hypothetical protein BP5553_07889 [Venustampulla echinocandica]
MDPLSTTAGVFAVIQLTVSVGSALKAYYEGARDARNDIQKLYESINGLNSLLKRIQDVNRGDHLSDDTSGVLSQAQSEIALLEKKLKIPTLTDNKSRTPCHPSRPKHAPENKRTLWEKTQSLTWPFSKKEVGKILETLDRCKSSLGLEIGIEQLSTINAQFDIIADIRSEIVSAGDDELRKQIISWLEPGVHPSEEHNLARERHEETTGSWLIDSNECKSWLVDDNSFLWLNGGAGAGKSILCSTVIDHVQGRCKNDPFAVVVYWYFTFANTEKQNIHNCLRSLVAGIYRNRRDTPIAVREEYERSNSGQHIPNRKSLLLMLQEVMAGLDSVYLVLDALDECPKSDDSRCSLLDCIHDIFGWELAQLHILATSRSEVDISESFDSFLHQSGRFQAISVQGIHVERDIKKYLGHRLEAGAFRTWKPPLKRDIETKLASQADGMFRLVALQLDALSKLKTESRIRTAIAQLPKTLDTFYDRILLDIDEEYQEHAFRALQFIALASRPLSLDELAEAMVVQPENEPCLVEEDRFMRSSDILGILPSGLVTGIGNPVAPDLWDGEIDSYWAKSVQFAHFSVKEYLLSERLGKGPTLRYAIQEIPAHYAIARMCFAYLIYAGNQRPRLTYELYDRFPLLNYVARSWSYHLYHLESLGQKFDECLQKLAIRLFVYDSLPWRLLRSTIDISKLEPPNGPKSIIVPYARSTSRQIRGSPHQLQPVTWVSRLGLRDLLGIVLGQQPSVDLNIPPIDIDKNFVSPLVAAFYSGNVEVVEVLLNAEADPNVQGGHHGTALQAACVFGAIDVASLLLEKGADPNIQGGRYGTALQVTCARGARDIDIASLLLDKGADPNIQGGRFGTALQAACVYCEIDIASLLLDKGADPNIQGGHYGTALQAACDCGSIDVASLLLDKGADPNIQGGQHGTALQAACVCCSIDVARLLLDKGADPNIQGGSFGTALQVAYVARLLLENGADPNIQGGSFGTPLQVACDCGSIDVASLLLDKGADPNIQGGRYGNALLAMCHCPSRNIDMIPLLLRGGADVNLHSPTHGSALGAACSSGWMGGVEVFLEVGAHSLDSGISKSICQDLLERLENDEHGPQVKSEWRCMLSFLEDWVAMQESDEQPDMLVCLRNWKARHSSDEEEDRGATTDIDSK